MHDTRTRLRSFVEMLAARFGTRLRCVVLTGSHARGDALPSSDVDVWVVLDESDTPDLAAVGEVVARVGPGAELNAQCTTFEEAGSAAFREQFHPIQLHLDGVVLHGELALPRPTANEMRRQAGALAAMAMMGARHYIVGREPEASLAAGKLRRWVLGPLMWALRYDAHARGAPYPRSLPELSSAVRSAEAAHLVELYAKLQRGAFAGPWRPEVARAERCAAALRAAAAVSG